MIEEEEIDDVEVGKLEEKLDEQQWKRQQDKLDQGPAFSTIYTAICDRIRAENVLDTVMEEMEVTS